jgi:hypothetical protein
MTVVRAQDNTTARAYSTNDRFELRPTAALFNEKANAADVAATYVELAGDTMTGDLGVGATPLARMHVTKAAAEIARFTNSQTNGGDWEFKIGGNGFENRKFMLTDKYGGADNVRLSIDDGGRVRTPNQVAWAADFGGISLPSASVVYYPSYNTPKINVGGHFNASTGVMTVPVPGIYLLMGSFLRNSNAYVYRGRFYKNGVVPMDGELRTTEGFSGYNETSTFTHIISAAAGDTLAWGISCDASGQSLYTSGYNYFSGYLLG